VNPRRSELTIIGRNWNCWNRQCSCSVSNCWKPFFHSHLCVNDHRGTESAELARIRRVARAAFFKTEGGSCAPATWGLRLWNGRGEQMVTILFPNPHFDETWQRLRKPRWQKTELWEGLRQRYAGG
jgi:hypothetical protein